MNTHPDDHRRRFPGGRPLTLATLLLALGLLLPAVAAATARRATPALDQEVPPEHVTTDRLGRATLRWRDLPTGVDALALARVTLSPGATATAVGGTHLFVVETGALTVRQSARAYGTLGALHEDVPAGPPVTHGAGDQFLLPYDVAPPPAIANEGTDPAVALVVSLLATGGVDIEESLTGWSGVELLSVEEAASVGPPLVPAGWLGSAAIAVALTRVDYERGASHDVLGPVARLLAVDSGAVNVVLADTALFTLADATPRPLPATARVSLTPGDRLLVPGPGNISTRNVARGPSALLIVTVAQIYT